MKNLKKQVKNRNSILYGLAGLAFTAVLANPLPILAAPAVPPPGESIAQPAKSDSKPVVEADKATAAAVPAGTRFHLKSVKVKHEGMKLKDGELKAITDSVVGKEITSAELNQAVNKIMVYARSHGYPAAIAYIPEQTAKNGNLTLDIEPGRFDKITIENEGVLQDNVAKGYLAGLKQGDIIRTNKLEKSLRNLRDVPGIAVAASLAPGSEQGTSDLKVRLKDRDRDSYVLYAENYGSRSAGRYRYGLQANWFNLSRLGDKLNVGGLISNNHQHGYNIGYEIPTGHSATVLGIGYSRSDYELGGVFSQLGVEGKSDTFSLYGRTPLVNTMANVLNLVYAINYRDLTDKFQGIEFGDRHTYSYSLGVDGQARTPENALQYNLSLHSGRLTPDSQVADTLATLGHTKGRFFKGTFDITGLHKLGGPFELMLKASGQKAANNLDSSEHIYLGGAKGVRAYPQGEASGDEGILGTLELRYHTPVKGLVFSTYYDGGAVKAEKSRGGQTVLKGWGLGLTYSKPNDYFARIDYARRIGWDDNLSNDAKSRQRVWFIVGKIF